MVTRPTNPWSHGERTSSASPSVHSLPHSRNPVCEPGRIFMVKLLSRRFYALDGKAAGQQLSVGMTGQFEIPMRIGKYFRAAWMLWIHVRVNLLHGAIWIGYSG